MNYLNKTITRRLTLKMLFLALFFTGLVSGSFGQTSPPQTIPDLTFFKMNGQPFLKKDLTKSKKIVIVFFDITCDHCQEELKAISHKIDEFKNTEFYLVSMDNIQGIHAFMKKFAPKMNGRANVTLLTDLNRQFLDKFKPAQYPATYVYGSNWKLIKYFKQNSKISDIISTVNK